MLVKAVLRWRFTAVNFQWRRNTFFNWQRMGRKTGLITGEEGRGGEGGVGGGYLEERGGVVDVLVIFMGQFYV